MQLVSLLKSSVIAAFGFSLVICGTALAQDVKAGDLVISHAWSRATPGSAHVGAGYLTIKNNGAAADKLVGGSSQVAADVEVHEMAMKNDVMIMRPVSGGLAIPPGQSVALAPGGYHLMMMNLKAPLKQGERVPITLQFEKAGKVDVVLDVQGIGAMDMNSGSPDHSQKPMQMNQDHKM